MLIILVVSRKAEVSSKQKTKMALLWKTAAQRVVFQSCHKGNRQALIAMSTGKDILCSSHKQTVTCVPSLPDKENHRAGREREATIQDSV